MDAEIAAPAPLTAAVTAPGQRAADAEAGPPAKDHPAYTALVERKRAEFAHLAPQYELQFQIATLGRMHEVWRQVASLAVSGTTGPVLELCCGTGGVTAQLARLFRDVTAVDLSPDMLARAAKRLEREGLTHARLREAEISTLRLEPGSFAAVVISLGLHELPISIRNHILEQAAVWLKPGGRFVFCDYAKPRSRPVAAFLRWIGRLVIEEEHFDEFMDYSIEEKLGRHGFTLAERRRRFFSCLEIGAWTARGAAAPAATSGPPAAQALPARAGDPPALRPLAAAELTGMSHVLAEAFMADPLYQALAPNPRARARWLRWVMALSLRASHQLGGAFCLEDAPGAGAVCLIPSDQGKRSSLDYLRAVPGLPPLGSGVLRWIGRGLGMKHLLLKAHHRGPHVHVLAVGVAPNRQGRGAGGALLRGALRMAAERGLPCYLETASPRNVQLYQHLGFRVERLLTPRGLPPIWTMLCPPPGR